jgi:hypothetical protein
MLCLQSVRMLIPARTGDVSVARNDSAAGTRRIPVELWLLLAVTGVGAALRFATLTGQSYWFDEAQASHELHLSFGAMLSSIGANEPNPPLYFVVGWLWAKLFGTGEAGLRSLSAIAGTVVIPIAYLCGRELVSRRAGLLAAALAAVSPFMIWYSQEAREYMLFAALCGASLLFFVRARREPTTRRVLLWVLCSALALLTQYFAGFLVAPEAVLLLYAVRKRVVLAAWGVLVAVEAALVPHLISHASHPTHWIGAFPLAIRVKQVPVTFGLSTLYQSSLVTYGLLGAAVLAGCLIVLLVIGADAAALRGAGVAAGIAAFVVLAPLALALLGRDYYEARALMPAWIPLAVVVAAACTAPRARAPGAALAVILLGAFVWAGIRVNHNSQYQRPNWRGVAAALGTPSGRRAIVAYDGTFATAPLALYLAHTPWTSAGQNPQTSQGPVSVTELDIVGSTWQTTARPLPAGTRLIGRTAVDGYLVERFSLSPALDSSPAVLGARARSLLGPAAPGPAVLVQQP